MPESGFGIPARRPTLPRPIRAWFGTVARHAAVVVETDSKPAAHSVPVGGTSTGHQAVSSGGRFIYVGSPHGVFLDAVPGTDVLG